MLPEFRALLHEVSNRTSESTTTVVLKGRIRIFFQEAPDDVSQFVRRTTNMISLEAATVEFFTR